MKERCAEPRFCTIVGLIVNIVLTGLKLIAGIIGHSQAMIADALHSFSDVIATGGVYIGLRISERPADRDHPFGHGNADTLAAIFVAVILLLTGGYIGISALHILLHQEYHEPTMLALSAAVLSIVVKEILYRYTLKVGKEANSQAVIANAYDHRSDAYSSVAALVGIGGAKLGMAFLDPLAGLVIAGLIIRMSMKLMRPSVNILMDGVPDEELLEQVTILVEGVPGVMRTSKTRIHPVGPGHIVDVEIHVDGGITVDEGHHIATRVKRTLMQRNELIKDVVVHVEPDVEAIRDLDVEDT